MTLASSTALGWLVWRREKNKKLLSLKIAFVRHVLFSPFESQLGEKVRNISIVLLYSKWKQKQPF